MPRKNPASMHLPPEVVHMITDHLLAEEPVAVFSLARTSKTYYAYCQPAIQQAIKSMKFHDIKIAVPRPRREASFEGIVNRLIKRLKAANGLACVRRVFVAHPKTLRSGWFSRAYDEENEWKPPYLSTLLSSTQAADGTTQYGEWQETALSRPLQQYSKPDRDFSDDPYEPVVRLIKMLPNLSDLIWIWSNGIPSCILETLHRDQPQCRLHLDYFFTYPVVCRGTQRRASYIHWRSFSYSEWHEMSSLHSIRVGVHYQPSYHDHQEREPFLRAITSAPNLKELRFRINTKAPGIPSESESESPFEKLSLEAFCFESKLSFDQDTLYSWSFYTDFSMLQTLEIHGQLHDHEFDAWGREKLSFPSLRTLKLNLRDDSLRSAEFYNSAKSFLLSVPPLAKLELEGWHSLISIESLVAHHGPKLRKLKLLKPAVWQFVNEEEIRIIDEGCPLLSELGISLNRSQDEYKQLVSYMALGSMKNLRTLHLWYEITPPRQLDISREAITSVSKITLYDAAIMPDDPSFDEFQRQPCGYSESTVARDNHPRLRNGHVEKIIVDSIIDKKLACEIFQVLSDSKPLESAKLKDVTISMSGSNYGHNMARIVDTFSTSWHVTQVKANSHNQQLMTVAEEVRPIEENSGGWDYSLAEWLEPVFRRLFPEPQSKRPARKTSRKLGAKRDSDQDSDEYEAPPAWRRRLCSPVPIWSPRSSSSQGKGLREKVSLRSGKASWGVIL